MLVSNSVIYETTW